MTSDPVNAAMDQIRKGGIVAIVDDGLACPELDLAAAAETFSVETLVRMLDLGTHAVCLPASGKRLDVLGIPVRESRSLKPLDRGADVTATVGLNDLDLGNEDECFVQVVRALASSNFTKFDFCSPGPVTPIRARDGGVLRRLGHTEAAVDLVMLAGLAPVAVTVRVDEIGVELGDVLPQEIVGKLWIPVVRISEIVHHRRTSERLVYRVSEARIPTEHGVFQAIAFHDTTTREDHVALTFGEIADDPVPLVRVHSECLTGDVFGSLRCDCGDQLAAAMERIAAEGCGVVLYMRQEGRGIGLANKLRAYELQDGGLDTVDANNHLGFAADLRDYGVGVQILRGLGITDIRLITNNPKKTEGFRAYGLNVIEQLPLTVQPSEHNRRYLDTKRTRMGHTL